MFFLLSIISTLFTEVSALGEQCAMRKQIDNPNEQCIEYEQKWGEREGTVELLKRESFDFISFAAVYTLFELHFAQNQNQMSTIWLTRLLFSSRIAAAGCRFGVTLNCKEQLEPKCHTKKCRGVVGRYECESLVSSALCIIWMLRWLLSSCFNDVDDALITVVARKRHFKWYAKIF